MKTGGVYNRAPCFQKTSFSPPHAQLKIEKYHNWNGVIVNLTSADY